MMLLPCTTTRLNDALALHRACHFSLPLPPPLPHFHFLSACVLRLKLQHARVPDLLTSNPQSCTTLARSTIYTSRSSVGSATVQSSLDPLFSGAINSANGVKDPVLVARVDEARRRSEAQSRMERAILEKSLSSFHNRSSDPFAHLRSEFSGLMRDMLLQKQEDEEMERVGLSCPIASIYGLSVR